MFHRAISHSHSIKFNISKLFLFQLTEYTYFLSDSGSVGALFKLLDKFDTTVSQNSHCVHTIAQE
ncbi:hypothetical protein HOB94_02120 [bacterium]|jgi:hypothetical protein|nr:hypothetical protein [bacterium]MBT4632785.1 hypothetical protein [bacterium]MBT6779104.1 hypothetical protein [bacterium]